MKTTTKKYNQTMDDYILTTRLAASARSPEAKAAYGRLLTTLQGELDRLGGLLLAAR